MTRLPRAIAIAALTLTLAACGGGDDRDDDATPSATPTPAVTSEEPTGPYLEPSDGGGGDEDAPAGDDSIVNAEADDEARQGATDAALATTEVWVQGTTMEQQEWNDALLETIAPISRTAYDSKWWGYRVDSTEITGDPELSNATMTTATVTVPTDAGDLTLTVTRADESADWLTTGLEPPAAEAAAD